MPAKDSRLRLSAAVCRVRASRCQLFRSCVAVGHSRAFGGTAPRRAKLSRAQPWGAAVRYHLGLPPLLWGPPGWPRQALFDIGHICLYCTGVHLITFLLFSLLVFDASFGAEHAAPARQQ
jgi:hypothetical protein